MTSHECTKEDLEAYMLWCSKCNEAAEAQYRDKVRKSKERIAQRWKIRADGDITRTQEIVHLGQQTLKRV